VVIDASAVIRALVDLQPAARTWLDRVAAAELAASWPAHLYAEVANSLVRLVRFDRIDVRRASSVYARVRGIPADTTAADSMESAMQLALERRLSAYDAAYVVLAEALDAPLVTADRRLAEATEQAVLLPG
jgi:predicted nucleic acid-binding protein